MSGELGRIAEESMIQVTLCPACHREERSDVAIQRVDRRSGLLRYARNDGRSEHNDGNGASGMRDVRPKIAPVGILRFDERQLLRTRAGLDLLLAGNRSVHIAAQLVPHENLARVAAGETADRAASMLPTSLDQGLT
jgi:hypothetical protein